MSNTTAAVPSSQLIAEWSGKIGVYMPDDCTWTVRLYADRASVTMPNTTFEIMRGSRTHEGLLALASAQDSDDFDHTHTVSHLVSIYLELFD